MSIFSGIKSLILKTRLELISSLIFVCLFVNLPDIDLNNIARYTGLNTRISLYLAIIILCLIGGWLVKYSKIIAGYVYIIVFFLFNTQMRYIELFQDSGSASTVATLAAKTQLDKLELSAGDLALAEDFLIKQTAADPNRTDLEKQVISDLIKQYFLKSNKLTELRDFNDKVLQANPIGGPQEITGLAAGVV